MERTLAVLSFLLHAQQFVSQDYMQHVPHTLSFDSLIVGKFGNAPCHVVIEFMHHIGHAGIVNLNGRHVLDVGEYSSSLCLRPFFWHRGFLLTPLRSPLVAVGCCPQQSGALPADLSA